MTDTIYKKRGPARLYYGFRVKLIVFIALTNCFSNNFMHFLIKDAVCFLGGVCEPRQGFQLLSNVSYDFWRSLNKNRQKLISYEL